jgi:hypothetical protein
MEFGAEELRLVYASEDILIRGRCLHPLYVELASQSVMFVVQQGERYAALSEPGTVIRSIERSPHTRDPEQQQQQ